MNNGGYQIISLNNKSLSDTPVKIAGITNKIAATKKAILLTGITIADIPMQDAFVNVIHTTEGYSLVYNTVNDDDSITVCIISIDDEDNVVYSEMETEIPESVTYTAGSGISIASDTISVSGVPYLTTAPAADNTDGTLKFVVLTAEPATRYNGYVYLIVEPSGPLINFTIDQTSYQAELGMTWGEWVNSAYNTDGYFVGPSNMIFNMVTNKYVVMAIGTPGVLSSSTISDLTDYFLDGVN